MGITVITSHNDESETRYHLDAVRCTHVLRGVPAWIAERPNLGGTHSLSTCEACANSARIRAMFAQSGLDDSKLMENEHKENEKLQRADYLADHDHRRTIMRTCLRYVALAERCPERQLPDVIKQLRIVAATHKQHMILGHGVGAHTLHMWAQASADVAWERYRLAYHAS